MSTKLTRRDFLRRSAIVGAGVAALPLLEACAPAATPTAAPPATATGPTKPPAVATAKRGGTLTVAQNAAPKSMTSIIDPGKPGIHILNQTEEGLLGRDEKFNVVPVLATGMPETPDNLTYVFKIRQDVRFSNGQQLTSAEVKYGYDRLLDAKYKATFGQVYRDNIASIETPDKFTIVFKMKQPWPIFLSFVAGNHPKAQLKALGEDPAFGIKIFGGTGPFMISEWVQGDHITIVRNENYYINGADGKPLPYIDKVVYKTIPEDSTAIAALETGQVDVLQDPPFKDLKRFAADAKYKVYRASAANCQLITVNNTTAPLNDVKVRKAISLAINRQEIVDTVWYGYADIAGDFFPLNHWAHDASLNEEFSVDKAKALLKEAGYSDAKPVEFTLIPLNEAPMMDAAALIQTQLAKAGMKVNIRPMEYTATSAMLTKPQTEWLGNAVLHRITPLRGTAYEFTYYQYGKDAGGALNYEGYNRAPGAINDAAETLMKSLNSISDFVEADRVKAKPLYKQLSQYVMADQPRIRLVWWNNADVTSAAVKDWTPAEGDVNLLNKTWLDR